ncbi:MAG: hypothetical protein DELT_02012 [Desulfovibrio sp.]
MERSGRELCLVHANCQGEPLELLLGASPEFRARWHIRHYTNYTKKLVPAEDLKNATLFLYQHLGPEWEAVSSETLLGALNPKAVSLCIPNMFFKGYWPFWSSAGPMNFADALLEKLYASGAGKPEILKIYLHGDVTKMTDIDAVLAETLRVEEAKERRCDVKTAAFVAAHWQKRRLFQTVNHPGEELLLLMAQGILARLGLPLLDAETCASFQYGYEGFQLPIHPQVAAHLGLPFGGEETAYPVFGRYMTFAQYVSRYIDCRMNGFEDSFLAYLQVI